MVGSAPLGLGPSLLHPLLAAIPGCAPRASSGKSLRGLPTQELALLSNLVGTGGE